MTNPLLSRRTLLVGGLGLASVGALSACTSGGGNKAGMPSRTFGAPSPVSPSAGQKVVDHPAPLRR